MAEIDILRVTPPDADEIESGLTGRDIDVMPMDPRDLTRTPDTGGVDILGVVEGEIAPLNVVSRAGGNAFQRLRAQFGWGIGDLAALIPDYVLNKSMDWSYPALSREKDEVGVSDEDQANNPGVSRNLINRWVNKGSYEDAEYIIPLLAELAEKYAPEAAPGVLKSIGSAIGGLNAYGTGQMVEPGTAAERIARVSGQTTAMAVPFIGASARLAQSITPGFAAARATEMFRNLKATNLWKEGKEGGNVLNILREAISKPYERALTRGTSLATPAAVEAGLSAVSGAGYQVEEEISPLESSTGIGALSPIVVPALAIGIIRHGPVAQVFRWGSRMFGKAKGRFIEEKDVATGKTDPWTDPTEVGVKTRGKVVGAVEKASATPEAQANIARAEQLELALEPYGTAVLSPGERTMDPGLLAMQAISEKQAPLGGIFSKENILRRLNVLKAITGFKEDVITGDPNTDVPMVVWNAAKARLERTVGRMSTQETALDDQLSLFASEGGDLAVLPIIPAGQRAAPGAHIRAEIKRAKETILERADQLAKELGINEKDALAGADRVTFAKDQLRKLLPRDAEDSVSYKGIPALFRRFLEHKFKNGQISFQDWKGYRAQVGDAIGIAINKGAQNDIRYLKQLQSTLDELAESSALARTNVKFKEYRNWYSENVFKPFDAIQHIMTPSVKGGTAYLLKDESVAKAFLQSREAAATYAARYGDNPEMMQHLRAAALDDARAASYIVNKGQINPDKLNSYINKKGDALEAAGFLDEFTDTRKLLQDMADRLVVLGNRKTKLDGNALYKALMKSENDQNPEKLIASMMSKDPATDNIALATQLRSVANREAIREKNPGILTAYNQAVMRRMLQINKNIKDDPEAFMQFLNDHERLLDAALTPEHVDNMYLLSDAYYRAMATTMPEGKADIATFLEGFGRQTGFTMANMSNRFLAVREGRLGRKGIAFYFLGRMANAQSRLRTNKLWEAAILNPDLAKTLTTNIPEGAPVGTIPPKIRDTINAYMFTLGIPFGEEYWGLPIEAGVKQPTRVLFGPHRRPPAPAPNVTITPVPQTPPPPPITTPGSAVQVAPPPTPNVNVAELFPFDPTSQAIARRREAASGGIGSLMG